MVNKSGLQLIGWLFAGTTAVVMLVAALLVNDAVASNPSAAKVGGLSLSGQVPNQAR